MTNKLSLILILIGCLAGLIFISTTSALSDSDYNVRSFDNFNVYFPQGNSILFLLETINYNYVALNPTLGNLNGSDSSLWVAPNFGGQFVFTAQETCLVELTESIDTVKVNGIVYETGNTFSVNSGTQYIIEWSYTLTPLLPFSLILGVLGLCMVFGGPIYAVHSFRKEEYRTALITCTIITLVGAALVIGWFWG